MKLLAATVMSLSLLATAYAQTNQAGAASVSGVAPIASTQDSQAIQITRSGSQPSRQGPAENFTGSVRVDPLFQANPGQEQWRVFLEMAKRWRDAVNKRGGNVTLVHLPEVGVRGNTHFPMSDMNNLEIADLMTKFLKEKRLD